MDEASCALDDCTRTLLALGLCRRHYERFLRCGDPLWHEPELKEPRSGSPKPPCRLAPCLEPERTHGLCGMHYGRYLRHGDPLWAGDRVRGQKRAEICTVRGCEEKSKAVGLCSRDYQRWVYTGEPTGDQPARTPKERGKRKPDHPCAYCKGPTPPRRTFCSSDCKILAKGLCGFPRCTNGSLRSGLCGGHLQQRDRTGALSRLRHLRSAGEIMERDELGRKLCTACHVWRPVREFGRQRERAHLDGLAPHCRWCARGKELLKKFGITVERYLELLDAQAGCCAVCLEAPARPFSLSVDHDHACCQDKYTTCGDCVRGLLCQNCNLLLGHARDRVGVLQRSIAYLERFEVQLQG